MDIATGDANASMHRAFNYQSTPSIAESSLHKMMLAMARYINLWANSWPNYVDVHMASSSTSEDLGALRGYYEVPIQSRGDQGTEAPSVDCIVTYHLSRGNSSSISKHRKENGRKLDPDTQAYESTVSPDEIKEKAKAHIEGAERHDFRISVDNYSMLLTTTSSCSAVPTVIGTLLSRRSSGRTEVPLRRAREP